ncbi:uncharacterized protein [Asterias amurensis]|uniref:uncharacterized protein n=1 Tax=Asterias amurensis TaxID=7602 RepID=UPI003AB2D084
MHTTSHHHHFKCRRQMEKILSISMWSDLIQIYQYHVLESPCMGLCDVLQWPVRVQFTPPEDPVKVFSSSGRMHVCCSAHVTALTLRNCDGAMLSSFQKLCPWIVCGETRSVNNLWNQTENGGQHIV